MKIAVIQPLPRKHPHMVAELPLAGANLTGGDSEESSEGVLIVKVSALAQRQHKGE